MNNLPNHHGAGPNAAASAQGLPWPDVLFKTTKNTEAVQ